MRYIIMCGAIGDDPRHLWKINGEPIVCRTIRLLRERGVTDIAISSNNPLFDDLGVPVLHHQNDYGKGGRWIDGFYHTEDPVCYIYGDVVFSEKAIEKIVTTETDYVEFFASAPPFTDKYYKPWAEPFAFKVVDVDKFWDAVATAKVLYANGLIKRLISWELWQVIKRTPLNLIDYTNYTAINDFTCDVDDKEEFRTLIESGVIE